MAALTDPSPSAASNSAPHAPDLLFRALVAMRWVAIAGQVALLLLSRWLLDVALPWPSLALVVAITAVSNVAAWRYARRDEVITDLATGGLLLLDLLLLTALLYFTGGPSNPFSVLFLVQVTLAAVMLPARWVWMLAVVAVLCFGALFFEHRPLVGVGMEAMHASHGAPHVEHPPEHLHGASAPPAEPASAPHSAFSLHLQGMWVAFTLAALVIAYFVSRVSTRLRAREVELERARALAAKSQRLASLATLAAGAAHELGSPLGTIAVVAKELERACGPGRTPEREALLADVQLVAAEVRRCRTVLDRMAGAGGELTGEALTPIGEVELVADVRAALSGAEHARLVVDAQWGARRVLAPARGLAQVVVSLVRNGLSASEGRGPVELALSADEASCVVLVRDSGVGMEPAVLERAGEPFFTTKEPGTGMGLGLFLARTLAETLGGSLEIRSAPGQGTRVILRLPAQRGAVAAA